MNGILTILTFSISLFFYVIFSWFFIHLLAFFGIFLALAYPIWWFVLPKLTICVLCRSQKGNNRCFMCSKSASSNNLVSNEGNFYPANLSSVILNSVIIILFSFFSLGIVYAENLILNKAGVVVVPRTVSFSIPSKGQYRIGEIFPVKLQLENIETPINVVQADIGFDNTRLEVVNISIKDSFANVFIQNEINNQGGWARLTGGIPNPGFRGGNGVFGTVYVKGLTPGLAELKFLKSSLILANDGKGTNVLKSLPTFSYFILPEKISTEEEMEQQKLLSDASVLGVSTDSNLLVFYDEKPILYNQYSELNTGNNTANSIGEYQTVKFNIFEQLKKIDEMVLSFWMKVFGLDHLNN